MPPVDNPAEADVAARLLARDAPDLIPELMWDTSYPQATACCTRGALAYSLVHSAIRGLLERK
jgi:hypothetical protein